MAKPEIKISITETGADKAAAGIGKVDSAADKASKGGLKGLADHASGPLKSALGGIPGASDLAGGGITALGGVAAAGAGALAAFAVKGVMAFEQTTTAVGQFRDATGTTSEEASRLYEVFGDLGVGADAGAAAIGKMEKTLGTNAEAFKQFGVEVVRAKDGTIDAQGTFLNAVDALNKIEDPAKKAAAGAAIFGKGWASMSEIIGSGAPALQKALESVQPSKVFSDKDIQSGRDVRDAFDSIKDAGEGLLLTIGKSLAPAIAKIAPAFADMITKAEPLIQGLGDELADLATKVTPLLEALGKIPSALQQVGDADVFPGVSFSIGDLNDKIGDSLPVIGNLKAVNDALNVSVNEVHGSVDGLATSNHELTKGYEDALSALETLNPVVDAGAVSTQTLANAAIHADDQIADLNRTTKTAAQRQADMDAAARGAARAFDAQRTAVDQLKGEISDDQAWIDLQDTFDEVKAKGAEAWDAVANKTADADQKVRDYQSSVNTAKSNVIDLGEQIGLSIPEVKSMLLQIDDGAISTVEDRLRVLTRNREISISIIARSGAGYGPLSGARAAGGPVEAGKTYMVGEKGPEPVTFGANGYVHPNSSLTGSGGGGNTYNVTVNGANMTPDELVRAIKKWERANGPAPIGRG